MMRDCHVIGRHTTKDCSEVVEGNVAENTLKKRGRPAQRPTLGAMTAAERKRDQRARQAAAIYERDNHEWTESECLAVLTGSRWRGGAIDKAAWEQLGRLRNFVTVTPLRSD